MDLKLRKAEASLMKHGILRLPGEGHKVLMFAQTGFRCAVQAQNKYPKKKEKKKRKCIISSR